jgi:hypothetical protein
MVSLCMAGVSLAFQLHTLHQQLSDGCRVGFVTLSMLLLIYVGWVRRLHARVCAQEVTNTDRSSAR